MRVASSCASPSYPGTVGTPISVAARRAAALSPIAAMASAGGPIQVRPAAVTIRAKDGFSARNPYPGWIASAPDRRATSRMPSASRYEGMSWLSCVPSAGRSPATCTPMTRSPIRRAVRAMRTAISPRFAIRTAVMTSVRGSATAAMDASDERDTLTREPMRLAGRRPPAIQRWTVRTVTPSSSATSRGVRSSLMSRLSQSGALFAAPGRRSLLDERAEALLALGGCSLLGDVPHGVPPGLVGLERPQLTHERLGGTSGGGASAPKLVDESRDARVQRRHVGHDLVDEAHPQRALGVESLAAAEERAGVRLADLRQHEGADDGRDDAQLRLGEAEDGDGSRQDDVGHRAQAHAAAQRGTLDARDDRHRGGVDGAEQRLHRRGVALVLLRGQPDRCAHPLDVGAGAEDLALAGQHDASQRIRRLGRKALEHGPQ